MCQATSGHGHNGTSSAAAACISSPHSEAVVPRDRDPGLAVLAVALCGPQGNVVLRIQKPVGEVLVGDGEVLEVMALLEGLHAALELDIRSVKAITRGARGEDARREKENSRGSPIESAGGVRIFVKEDLLVVRR
ncbi:hypothetical protein C2845_PM07G12900 [Panicum miliaceum]|uniref:Uncharacterized protein n=1 Tax=Panicum miliaceum TaxID=4540 RepID=A0A3L6SQB8_PANMI|nr:hypothetical protein C2845_PM07G12900 [Panicum miliaceum]